MYICLFILSTGTLATTAASYCCYWKSPSMGEIMVG